MLIHYINLTNWYTYLFGKIIDRPAHWKWAGAIALGDDDDDYFLLSLRLQGLRMQKIITEGDDYFLLSRPPIAIGDGGACRKNIAPWGDDYFLL